MALRLRIISDHRRLLGERSSVTFDASGGTIGRSADNDWVLPDPQRFVSAHHARIVCRDGHYLLEDLSTNGVFVNDDERPVAKHGPYRLQTGDVLRLGEYQVVAALEADAGVTIAPSAQTTTTVAAGPAAGGTSGSVPVPTHINVLHTVGRASQTDLGAALDLDELLVSDAADPEPLESPSGSRLRPVNAYGQAVALATAAPTHQAERAPARAADTDEQEVARRMDRLARAIRAREAQGASLPALYDVQSGLVAFCRGAGIEADQLPADSQTRLMHLVGQLFREAFVGLKDLERARHEIHNRFRIEFVADSDDSRPSLARSSIEELLVKVLIHHDSRRVDAVQWLRETIEGVKAHERATAEAMREAFVEFVGRFDPAELEARFQRTARRGKSASNEARYWQLFAEFYRNLTEMPADHLPHTFIEAFASAYKRVLQKPPAT